MDVVGSSCSPGIFEGVFLCERDKSSIGLFSLANVNNLKVCVVQRFLLLS